MRTPIAIIAEKGVVKDAFADSEVPCGKEALGSGVVRSVKEAEDSRSVTAEIGPVELLEDSICEDVYILGRKINRQFKLTYRRAHEKPLHSKWQLIAAGYVLNHDILYFNTRSQQ